ncbi:MAG TPA: adenylate/guanylate cyclase domain-containing protein [Dehalococcoidia bacterium]|nr:adenylate/guanylate cyclase domain-containing protein [Dehalococcoidia bacterium]
MEPRIQFAKTSDGVNIAFCVSGQGRTVVRVPTIPWSHVQQEWENFNYFLPLKPLAENCRIVWYDARGCGLSDRQGIDFSLDAMVRDLSAVVGKLGDERVDLCGIWDGAPVAVAYAAANPERVSSAVLVEAYPNGADYLDTAVGQVELGIRDKDWVLYTEMLARVLWGFREESQGSRAAEYMRACATAETLLAAYDAVNYTWDVTDMLPLVTASTLVLHSKTNPWMPVTAGQRVAAAIPDSLFGLLEDMKYDSLPARIAEFLDLPPPRRISQIVLSGTAVILFADVVDSTALTERLGDTAFRDKARDLDTALRAIIRDNAGTPVEGKLLGDGVLAVFASARLAIEAAIKCGAAGDGASLPLHLGLHAGDVIEEDGNVFGGAVNIAARIAGESAAGEVLVSDIVRGLARTSAGVDFEDAGERELKGVSEPVRVWAVREAG